MLRPMLSSPRACPSRAGRQQVSVCQEHHANPASQQPNACKCEWLDVTVEGMCFSMPNLECLEPVSFAVQPAEVLFVEVFCGAAGLSKAAQASGLSVMPIDRVSKTHSVSVVCLDFTKPQDQRILFECLAFANVGAAHIAPPCGTSSAARERPLPPALDHLGTKPLRSADDPWGRKLPETAGDKARVQSANCLYVVTVIACAILTRRGAFVSCESPTRSNFWQVAELAACSLSLSHAWEGLEDSVFDSCMWGGEREKATTFRATQTLCRPLRRRCDGQHTHKPWTPTLRPAGPIFPTASEAEYPRELCEVHLSCLWRQLHKAGVRAPKASADATARAARDLRQFSMKRVPPLLGELKKKFWLVAPSSVAKLLPGACSKPVKSRWVSGKVGNNVELPTSAEQALRYEKNYAEEPSTTFVHADEAEDLVGIYRTPLQTVQACLKLRHPIEFASPVPDLLMRCVVDVLNMGPVATVNHRTAALKSILGRRGELASKEAAVHAALHPDLKACLRGKQTCLWHELLQQTGFPDLQLVDDVRQGFEVIGPNPWSPVFRKGYKPPQLTPHQLAGQAVWRRQKVVSSCRPSDDANLDEELWQQTMAECEKGWVSGPYMSEAEVSRVLASDEWLCTKRFPLIQGDKIRLIDDALASGVNAAFSTFNKLKLMDIDTLVSLTTAAALAPGTEDTFAALSDPARRPPALINCPADVRDLQPDAPATLTDAAVGQALRSSRRGTAAGLSGATCEHYKVLLDDAEALELFAHAANLLASAQIPANIAAALAVSRLTALRKPAGGVRGIATGDTFRRLVSRCLARQYADTFDQATRPYQFALQTRAGTDALSGMLRAAIDLDADATIVSLDGRSAYDTISRAAFLCKLREVAPALVPFVRLWYGQESTYYWWDASASGGASVRAKAASKATPWPQPCTRLASTPPSLLPTSACNLVNAWPPSSTTSTL